MDHPILVVCVVLALGLTTQAAMVLESPLFKNGELIPGDFGCDIITGSDRDPYKPSPSLQWFRPPAKTQSYVLLVDDVDNEGFVHWLVKDIPRNVDHIDVDASGVAMPEGATELTNSYGALGWGGPCPIASTHLYRFRLYALNVPSVEIILPAQPESLQASDINKQIEQYALYVAVLSGEYTVPEATPSPAPPLADCPDAKKAPANDTSDIKIIRYFKPSESLKKNIGKSQGVYDNKQRLLCRRGQLSAQLCKRYIAEEPSPLVIRAPFFPPGPVDLFEPRTISTDTAADLSPDESARRAVRQGGLEPVNFQRGGMGLVAPIQETPNVAHPSYDSRAATMIPTTTIESKIDADCDDSMANPNVPGEMNTQILLQDDVKSMTEKDLNEVVTKLTTDLEEKVGPGCNCHKGYIAPGDRKYSLTIRSPIFFDCNHTDIPEQFVCDRNSPSVSRQSIPFVWRHVPASCKSLVLVVDEVSDFDSSGFGTVLWIVANIPNNVTNIAMGASGNHGDWALPLGATELVNSFGYEGYTAPCPGTYGVSYYRARLFALETPTAEISLTPGYTSNTLDKQLRPIVTASMEMQYTLSPPVRQNTVAVQKAIAMPQVAIPDMGRAEHVAMQQTAAFFPDLDHGMMNSA